MLIVITCSALGPETCELKGFRVFRSEGLNEKWKGHYFKLLASTARARDAAKAATAVKVEVNLHRVAPSSSEKVVPP